jgi:hypothetical protein
LIERDAKAKHGFADRAQDACGRYSRLRAEEITASEVCVDGAAALTTQCRE